MKPGCPSTETLSAYLAGKLPPERSAGVVAHTAQCGLCDNLLERLKVFDEPIESSLSESEWRSLERDLTADFKRRLPKTQPLERHSLLRAWFWRPALGYALAVVLSLPATLWFLRDRVPAQARPAVAAAPPSAAAWVPTLELSPTRGRQSAADALPPSDEFVLRLFVPSKMGTRYSAEIRDSAGKPLVTVHDLIISDSRGSLSLLCRRQAFPPGDYTVAVTEVGGDGEPAFFPFHL